MNSPLISVVLPVFNVIEYLEKCIKTVLSQTYSNLEIILVDDGSTDGCGALCDEYMHRDDRVVVYHKSNGGLSDARNFGVERARGEYVTYIDPDDFVDEDYVAYLYSLIRKYNSKMSICQHRVKYNNGHIKDLGSQGDEELNCKRCIERMLYHDVIDTSAWAKLYRIDLFDTVKYPAGRLFEDISTTYRLMMQCDMIAVGYESKYTYVFHNNSIVTGDFSLRKFDLVDMTDLMGIDVLKEYPDLEDAVIRRRVYSRISTLNQMIGIKGYEIERNKTKNYILDNRKRVINNARTPFRDKGAIMILSLSYPLYKALWTTYQRIIMRGRA